MATSIKNNPNKTKSTASAFAAEDQLDFNLKSRGRFWEVIDPQGELVCITVYKRGALEVIRRLRVKALE